MSSEMQANAKEAKQKRYDRQLRLWGEHGQEAMEECSVCLLNASASGSETLKNLVLPGIGSFTIVDGATVGQADLGNNFFVDESCVGKPRAAAVTELLQELNEHVSGSYVAEDISQVLASRPEYLNSFSLVIATQLATKELNKASAPATPHVLARAAASRPQLSLAPAASKSARLELHARAGRREARESSPPAAPARLPRSVLCGTSS